MGQGGRDASGTAGLSDPQDVPRQNKRSPAGCPGRIPHVRTTETSRKVFIAAWLAATLIKCLIAARLPMFVDEVFYWQEGRHPAWAYSDLPGLTAWVARLGVELGGTHPLGLRWPFLLMGAALPWWIVRLARGEGLPGHRVPALAWDAGTCAVLLPLLGALGVLALPDVPLAVATLCCLDAGARLLRGVEWRGLTLLAIGLVAGALTHYRFVAVIGVGFAALLMLAPGRRALRDPRLWAVLALGAAAWWPLLAWNLHNADAGLRFQLVDRHPWAFHLDGLWFVPVQLLMVSPLLLWAMLRASRSACRAGAAPTARYLAWSGVFVFAGFFALGFFADSERVSFHWPLPAYLAWLPLVPLAIERMSPATRRATWALAALGLVAQLGWYVAASSPALRTQLATTKAYPANFAGWDVLAREVAAQRARMPTDTRLLADNFKIGAELGFALDDPRIPVLDHPLNHKHGRAPQLHLWGLDAGAPGQGAVWGPGRAHPVLLVVGATDVNGRELLQRYHDLCDAVGPLPPPKVLNIDRGRQRFLLFALPAARATVVTSAAAPSAASSAGGTCTAPGLASIDRPLAGARVGATFEMQGWASREGTGLRAVEILIDGRPVARAEYGLARPDVAAFWRQWSRRGSLDPQHPAVGFRARVDARGLAPGRHWLGLRLHGRDGSVEDWPEQPVTIAP